MIDNNFPLYLTVFILTLAFTCLLEKKLIPMLQRSAQQPIYEEGPRWHMNKSGTPTMGGLAFVISSAASALVAASVMLLTKNFTTLISITICVSYALLNAGIGVIDDSVKLKNKRNLGLSAKGKLILQFILAVVFLLARYLLLGERSMISFSFGTIDLGLLYYPISIIILLGITNCANLTDGIDGLASSVAFSVGVSLFYISAALSTEASVYASAIIGASLGFLIFNLHPAKIFMGDTGSLFFGSLIASTSFALGNPIIAVFAGGVYVIEGVSVILQVLFYKLRGKRIFKMAPLHHHLEKCGWSENRICIVSILCTFIFSIPIYIFYLP